ncbi:hypothetical protein [Vampirovibrio chlorellavorus]|uniref:hypothetical protein n=1 Tax=Vampirovibrio chlorellavorus TaxID=758823 RepID=UPI0026E9A7B8|nr:hypothetical protein [Vampirovibrio chlorellavorus]
MDINRFQAKLSSFANAGLFKDKGGEAERIKKEQSLAAQSGPLADTVEINFARLAEVGQAPGGQSPIAGLVDKISQMSLPEAQAQFQNPEVFAQLVEAGILE